ncbi:hypothetical protein BKI52_41265 [marine bacterium AO1-C]|nr:hypothetical protein BKI52_41265 [marine bacterium AO1-C]
MNAYIVFGAVALILIYWPYRLFLRPILNLFKKQKVMQRISQEGMPIDGEVVESQYFGAPRSNGIRKIRITVALNNFVGTRIQEKFRFFDTRPQQERYTVGKSIKLFLSDQAIGGKKVVMAGGQPKINLKFLVIFLTLFSVAFYCTYTFIIQPIWLRGGQDLETIIPFFDQPTAALLVMIYGGVMVFVYFLFRFLGTSMGMKANRGDFKYYGKQATANITHYAKTGMRINDNPQVKFDITFTTDNGQTISSSVKKVIDELEIGRIHEMQHLEVMYLPENPQQVQLPDNTLHASTASMPQILGGVFRLLLFIFSIVVLSIVLVDIL